MNEVARERAQSFLKLERQQRILSAYQSDVDEPGFARFATVEEIAKQDYSLSIPLYVKRSLNGGNGAENDERSLREFWVEWEQDGRIFWQEMDALVAMLDEVIAEGND